MSANFEFGRDASREMLETVAGISPRAFLSSGCCDEHLCLEAPSGACLSWTDAPTSNGSERLLSIDFDCVSDEPRFKNDKCGFIFVDSFEAVFGTLDGNVLLRMPLNLPKKNCRGGASALRFARLRIEKTLKLAGEVAETAKQLFVINNQLSVTGLVLAPGRLMKNLLTADKLGPVISCKVLAVIDTAQEGKQGFEEVMEASQTAVRTRQELEQHRRLLQDYCLIMRARDTAPPVTSSVKEAQGVCGRAEDGRFTGGEWVVLPAAEEF